MFRASLERLFVRFRRNGDVSALSAVFDRTAPELIRVALHLARDPAEAEDLVQQTFLSAIESADTFDPRKRLVPWLLGILGNHAKKTARQERRVVDPARLRSAGTTDVTDAASDRDAAGVAGRAIDELPDPYRSVLVLRFRHGMEPAEIARALGVSAATVRSHLHRGLERVRRATPASAAPALFVGFPTSRGLDAVREVVKAKAAHVAATMAATSATSTVLAIGGGALMAKKAIVVVSALLLLGGGGVIVWRPWDAGEPSKPASASNESESRPDPALAARGRLAPLKADAPAPSESASALAMTDGPQTGDVDVTASWSDGTPAADLGVRAISWNEPSAVIFAHRGVTAADGKVRISHLRSGRVTVYGDHSGSVIVEVAPGTVVAAALRLGAGVRVEGTVIDSVGPVAGAEIWISNEAPLATRTDAAGRFTLRDVSAGLRVAARAPGRAFSGRVYVWGKPGETMPMTIRLGGPGGTVRGRVADEGGFPIAGARVLVGEERPAEHVRTDGTPTSWTPPAIVVVTGQDGEFVVEGIPPSEGDPPWKRPVAARAPGFGPATAAVVVVAGADARVDLTLVRGAAIAGVVRDGAGAPIPAAQVLTGPYGDFTSGTARADEHGAYVLDSLAPGAIPVRAHSGDDRGLKAEATIAAEVGETKRWDPVLGRGRIIRGRVIDEDGTPLVGYFIEGREQGTSILAAPTSPYRVQARTDTDGRFELPNCKEFAHQLDAFAPNASGTWHDGWALARQVNVRPGPSDVTLTVRAEDRPTVRLRGSVVGPDGRPVPNAAVFATHGAGGGTLSDASGDGGQFEIGPLPIGRVDLSLQAPGFGRVTFGERHLTRGQDLDVGRLVLETPGSLVVEIVDSAGAPQRQARCWAIGERGDGFANEMRQGIARFERLTPGTYTIWCESQGLVAADVVTIESGREATHKAVVAPGATRSFVVRLPATDTRSLTLRTTIRREDDPKSRATAFGLGPEFRWEARLPSGRYRVEAETNTGLVAEARFEVADPADPSASEIELTWR